MAKLVSIGDSLTQGFQSGAILETEWSYPAMVARSLGLSVPSDFRIPSFPGSGLPLNLEYCLRSMEDSLGADISTTEWVLRFPFLLHRYMDEVEYLYERGAGRLDRSAAFRGYYHNLSVFGFRVVDSFMVDSAYCLQTIDEGEGWIEDDFLGLPSAPMYRTAHKVLNPGNQRGRRRLTQLDTLKQIHDREGVENLVVFLGANDCLGTVFGLQVNRMPDDFASDDPEERRQYNLTFPTVFARDYTFMVDRINAIVGKETRIFVGTVPYVTIPPITRGIGTLPEGENYYDYYGRFFANPDRFNPDRNSHLTRAQIEEIDRTIDEFNRIIREAVARAGDNWHIVDIAHLLNSLAVKRNQLEGSPGEPLRTYLRSLGIEDHPLLNLDSIPSILLLETNDRIRKGGGLFSLDCIHPTTIGYGLVAEEVLRAMRVAGVPGADPNRLDWQGIIDHDTLLNSPPVLWDDIINAAEGNSTLWDVIFRVLNR